MKTFFPNRIITANELLIVPEAFFQLFLQRIKVSFFPSRKYLPTTKEHTNIIDASEKMERVKTIASVINGLSIRTPWSSTCLVKVLAAHKMLAKHNIPHTLYLGVNNDLSKGLNTHAWLSVANKVIIGGGNLHSFKIIAQINQ